MLPHQGEPPGFRARTSQAPFRNRNVPLAAYFSLMKALEMSELEPSWDHACQSFHSTRRKTDIQESKGCVSGHIANVLKFHGRLWGPKSRYP